MSVGERSTVHNLVTFIVFSYRRKHGNLNLETKSTMHWEFEPIMTCTYLAWDLSQSLHILTMEILTMERLAETISVFDMQ
jgi:hypothetical protein